MNDMVATNIRTLREAKPWTQAQLAEAAAVAERTIQRAEEGKGLSAETLQAVAGALDVPVALLRFDGRDYFAKVLGVSRDEVTPELIATRVAAEEARYVKVPLTEVKAASDLVALYDGFAMQFSTREIAEDAQDLAAELHQHLFDLMEIGRDIGPQQQREFMKEAFEIVTKLRVAGCATAIGVRRHGLKLRNESPAKPPMPWVTVYVIVTRSDDLQRFAAIERNAPYQLG